jgi:hypothetical protein
MKKIINLSMDDIILMKFGSEDNMNSLLKEGIIFCNTLEYYTREDVKANKQLADKDETCFNMKFYDKGILQVKGKDGESLKLNVTNFQLKEFGNSPLFNVYCMFGLRIPKSLKEETAMYSPDLAEFGTHFVLIQNMPEFLKRLDDALSKLPYKSDRRFVEYKDFSSFTGSKTAFQKNKSFEHQNEYRILIETHLSEPITVTLGSLEDVASLHEAKKEVLFTAERV